MFIFYPPFFKKKKIYLRRCVVYLELPKRNNSGLCMSLHSTARPKQKKSLKKTARKMAGVNGRGTIQALCGASSILSRPFARCVCFFSSKMFFFSPQLNSSASAKEYLNAKRIQADPCCRITIHAATHCPWSRCNVSGHVLCFVCVRGTERATANGESGRGFCGHQTGAFFRQLAKGMLEQVGGHCNAGTAGTRS